MNLNQFLAELAQRGVKLWVEDGQLRYRAPKGVLTPELRDDLALHKAEVVKLLHQSNANRRDADLPLVKVERDRDLPLSFAQARMWFLSQLEPNNPFYNEPQALRLHGFLNLVALEKSLNKIIARHSALRTNFVPVDGQPVQVIAESLTFSIPVVDLRDIPESEREISAQRLAIAEAQQPFDLASSPLIRTCVLKLTEVEHVLLLTIHHIVWDGWSWGILLRELATLYSAFCNDLSPELPELSIQYKDFAVWQRQWLLREVLESQLAYWKQQLEGAPALLELPTDRVRPKTQTFRGAHQRFTLSLELTRALVSLSQRPGITLFMTLLAAFQTFLYHYTGQSDICVGTPHANRDRPEVESLIGFFVNTLVLRTSLSGNPSFEDVLSRVKDVTLKAHAHQDLPFEKLVEELKLKRDLSYTPLVQVMLVLNVPMPQIQMAGLTVSFLPIETATAKFDLTLSFENTASGLIGDWEYNSDLFDASTIARMARHFQTLLEGIVANPQQKISQLPLLSEAERYQLLVEWNNTTKEYPSDKCIHQLFEEQVERSPDAVAVVFEDKQLTYRELNQRANRIAHHLKTLGVGPEVLVGICVERSSEMMVGLLGILKAGGAYVPLDPQLPHERLSFMLSDSSVPVLLTSSKLMVKLPKNKARVVCLDTDWGIISQESEENPVSSVAPQNLAYVIYTSGSTGAPKGTLIIHQGLVNYLSWCTQAYAVADGSGAPVHSSIGFDATITSLFSPLLVGKKVVLLPEKQEIEALGAILCSQSQFSLVKITPAHLDLLSFLIPNWSAHNQTRAFIIGGEALSAKSVSFWRDKAPSTKLINEYGPTETVVGCCVYEVDAQTNLSGGIPIGRAIANTQLYVLDPYLQPVPIGVLGELYIGGAGVARGYLNRPDLTSEKFIPNPFSNQPGSRLYKTGDKARYLNDGNIEFLGRLDNQVKIRGFRIELGEVEAAIAQYPGVRETVVVAREDIPDHKYLAAYIVPNHSKAIASSVLRSFLKEKLPDYMIPGVFMMLDALPLTPNGKVDRKALPTPNTARQELQADQVAPRTRVEELLTQIWCEVLHKEQVGIHDNFFELGGESILSILIISKANIAGVQITPKQIFQHQTIAELATVAIPTETLKTEQGLVTGSLPLTPIQHWFFEPHLPSPHHWNQAFLLEVQQKLDSTKLQQAVQQLLVHHDALRLRFTLSEEGWQQVNALTDEIVPFSLIDLSTLPPNQQTSALVAKATSLQASLNLESGPLLKVALFHLGESIPDRLLMVIHHLAVDGVSWRILLEDLQTTYQQLHSGQPIQLQSKTTSFKHWAQKLTEYAQTDAAKEELTYWQNISSTPITHLPIDCSGGANTEADARTVSVSLNTEETRALLTEVPKAYRTQINDVLLTALVLVLANWSQSTSVLIDLEGHGREEILPDVDLSRTVGWFTTIFPVLLKLIATENLGETLKSIKEQLRAIPNRGIGYGLLRYLSGDAEITSQLSSLPQAEVSFNYLGQFDWGKPRNSLFKLATESIGPEHSQSGHRRHLLDINGIVVEERLQLDWTYSDSFHQRATIEGLAHDYIEALRTIIAHCLSPEAFGYTPCDFPLAKLEPKELDNLLTQLSEISSRSLKEKIEDIYPQSPVQQGMLFHSLYAPDDGVYFIQCIWRIQGNLNVEAFAQAWKLVVKRHPILRTAFMWSSSDKPLQVVYREVKIPLEIHDWRGLSVVEREQQLETFLVSDRQKGFQLSLSPLMRLTLIEVGEEVYQFVWSSHHLLLDGWSVPPVIKEVFTFYEAFCTGTNVKLEPVRHYRDYIAWLLKQDLAKAEVFWRQTLKGFIAPTPLTVDRASTTLLNQHQRYSEQSVQLTVQLTEQLKSFARQHQLTLSTLVQGAWAILLSRYSGEADVVFGVTVSGRSAAIKGVESLVGLLINTLPMRVIVSTDDELLPWLYEIQNQLQQVSQYEYSPLVQIQQWSEVPQGVPLFESIVVFENYPVSDATCEQNLNLHISDVRSLERTNYPLTVVAVPGTKLSLHLKYDCQRFDDATSTRMTGHFQTILAGIVTNPQQKVSSLPLLTIQERHQLLVEWNNTTKEYPQDKCIHQLFEEQVERSPDAIAVVFEEEQLTYRELNQRANCLAHHLKTLGVGPEVLVGICVERSLEMVVGLLGILKAGGAYVPLDPAYPSERLAYMLKDASVPVLLTQVHLVEKLPQDSARIVCLDFDGSEIADQVKSNPTSDVTPDNLAYIIYTSGSTGKPKGVTVPHRAVNRLVLNTNYINLQSTEVVAFASNFSFDAVTFEIWGALLHGAKLIGVSKDVVLSPNDFAQFIQKQEISVLFLTTALFNQMASVVPSAFRSVQHLLFGGEAVDTRWVKEVLKNGSPQRLLHVYGPTESTTFTTWYLIQDVPAGDTSIPIGRPISNTRCFLLDAQKQPVPVGVPGELYIGGDGLARGYLNRPDLTDEKFIPNPFSNEPGSRLYKTGDKARYLRDGNIEFLGRLDNQVKIRGFRIELGEIEAALRQKRGVRETVVIAREDVPDRKYLVAYIVPNHSKAIASSDLRGFLSEKLPDYMIPGAFVMLDALPLTPNGKVDRKALPTPDTARQELQAAQVAPRTRFEEILAQIWREVFHREFVSIHDNFFEIGGDSILSIQIIFQANRAGLHLTPKQIFQHQTIADLAAVATPTGTLKAFQGLVTGSLPLTPIQHWFFAQNLPEPHHFNQAFLLFVPPTLNPDLLQQALQQLLVHHDALRLRFHQTEAGWQQFNAVPDETVPFSRIDLSTLQEEAHSQTIESTSDQLQASLNLNSGPLLRVALFHLGTQKPDRLLLVIHHLAVDGVSWRILLEDLQTAYQQLESGKPIQLPAKTTSFKHWAEKLTEYAFSPAAKKELTYWSNISTSKITHLPVDYKGESNTKASARSVKVSLNVEETRALLQEIHKAYHTQINDILLTALVQVLATWNGSQSVIIDLEGHGREEILPDVDLSRTVGWFTTIFPVLLELKATENLPDAIKSIKEQLRAIPNRGIGYGVLRYLSGDAEITSQLSSRPQAEVSFNYLGQFDWGMQSDSFIKLASESVGSEHSQLGQRTHLLEINGLVVEGQLQLEWTYSDSFHTHATIESLAEDFAASLRTLIAHCLSADAGDYTPDVFENPTLHSSTQPINNDQRQENNVPPPLHLLELSPGISELLPEDTEAAYPLAKMQEFMWHHYCNAPQKMGVYHCQLSYDIYDESLDLNAFKKALLIVVQKHPALRTVFITSNGFPAVQVVKKNLRFSINEQDISHIKSEEQSNYIDAVMKQDRQNLFDVENPNEPLFRFRIFQKAENKFEFLMSIHHAINDGWGNIEFLNELSEIYSALKKGEEIIVVPTANVYKEFVALEKEIISSPDASSFWKLHLKDHTYKPLKPLTTSVEKVEAVAEEYNFEEEVVADLRELCRKLRVSPKALFLSTYLDLIGTVMKSHRVCVGIVSNGRTERLSDPFGALGLFWNIVPFCQSISDDKVVQIKNVQQSLIDIEPYVRYPLLEILSDQQKSELFFATFNFVNFHNAKNIAEQTGLKVNARRSHDKFNFPLNYAVSMSPVEGNATLQVEYDKTYFSRQEIRSMIQNYIEILKHTVHMSELY